MATPVHFVCCSLRSSVPLLQYSELSDGYLAWIVLQIRAFVDGIDSLKQPDVSVKGRAQDFHECQTKESRLSEQLSYVVLRNLCGAAGAACQP